MERFFKIITNIGLVAFLLYTTMLVLFYIGAVWDKIERPQYKNMNDREVIYFGLVALAFIIINIFIVRRFIRLLKHR